MLSAKTNDAAKLTPDEADLETVGPGEAVQGINISELSLGDEFTIGQHMNTAVALDSKEGYQALVKHVEGVLLSDAPKEVKSKIKKELNTAVAVIVKEAKDIQDRRAWLEEETQKVNERDKHNLPLFMRGTAILGMAVGISKGIKADAAKDKKMADMEIALTIANEQATKNTISIQKLQQANETQRRQLTAKNFS